MSTADILVAISALAALRKAVHLYPETHPAYRTAFETVIESLQRATATGPLTVNVHLGRLYHESQVLPNDAPGARSLEQTLEAHRVESVTILPGVRPADILGLLEALDRKPSPAFDLSDELAQRGISTIVARQLVDEERERAERREREREQDRATYRRLVGWLHAMASRVQAAQEPNVTEALPVVESILCRMLEDSSPVLALTVMNGGDEAESFHSINTMIHAVLLGLELHIPPEGLTTLALSAMLHDIGKAMLDPRRSSSPDEYRRHPELGAEVLSRMQGQDRTPLLVAYEHHMGHDGSGFPSREAGYVTHPYSRMVAIADTYARLTAAPPSGHGSTPDEAVLRLLELSDGGPLDPLFTRLFVKALGVFPVGCVVRLSDQSVGVVCARGSDPLHPRVRLTFDADGLPLDPQRDIDPAERGLTIVEVVRPDDLALDVSEHL